MCYLVCSNKRHLVKSSTEFPTPALLEHFPMVWIPVYTLVKIKMAIYKALMKLH